jgi:hypothetical protein
VSKLLVTAGWAHAPHLSEQDKRELMASYPRHELEARVNGAPVLGSGAVFPGITQDLIQCKPFLIPDYFRRINGIDFGWDHPSAAVSLAIDMDHDTIYITAEHRQRNATPIVFAPAIKAWGAWIPCAWPHDGLQHDKGSGMVLAKQYKAAGLNMLDEQASHESGGNSVEAGIVDMMDRFQTGRLKVFETCENYFAEMRTYHRKDGKIVKDKDDLIAASRYAIMMRRFAKTRPVKVHRQIYNGAGDRYAGY